MQGQAAAALAEVPFPLQAPGCSSQRCCSALLAAHLSKNELLQAWAEHSFFLGNDSVYIAVTSFWRCWLAWLLMRLCLQAHTGSVASTQVCSVIRNLSKKMWVLSPPVFVSVSSSSAAQLLVVTRLCFQTCFCVGEIFIPLLFWCTVLGGGMRAPFSS